MVGCFHQLEILLRANNSPTRASRCSFLAAIWSWASDRHIWSSPGDASYWFRCWERCFPASKLTQAAHKVVLNFGTGYEDFFRISLWKSVDFCLNIYDTITIFMLRLGNPSCVSQQMFWFGTVDDYPFKKSSFHCKRTLVTLIGKYMNALVAHKNM